MTERLGPTLAEVIKSGQINENDILKVSVEILKTISALHKKDFNIITLNLENISFQKSISCVSKNRTIIINFEKSLRNIKKGSKTHDFTLVVSLLS